MAKNNGNGMSGWSLALLRLVLGIIFTYHGYLKLFVPNGFKGTVAFFLSLGIPVAPYSALLVSVAEFAGGLLLILGLLTKWASFVLVMNMIVAFFLVHWKNGLDASKGGYEFVLLILASLVVVLVNGAGALSLGSKFKNKHLK